MKKAPRETQIVRVGCSKVEPKNFAPSQTPFPGAQDGQNLISWWWSLPLPINQVWWRSMHAISSYRGNRPTNKQTHTHTNTHTQTHRQDRLQYTAPQLASAQCNKHLWLKSAHIINRSPSPGRGVLIIVSICHGPKVDCRRKVGPDPSATTWVIKQKTSCEACSGPPQYAPTPASSDIFRTPKQQLISCNFFDCPLVLI